MGRDISSLVVLPLWGWARRQFDDRVALVACLLYAVHPKFIIESPEVMRDPTFWFLFMLAIYWLVAGGDGSPLRLFPRRRGGDYAGLADADRGPVPVDSAGAVDVLAVAGAATGRGTLLLGAMLCVVAFPLLLVLVERGVAVRPLGLDDHPLEPAGPRAAVAGVVFGPRHGRRWPAAPRRRCTSAG